MSKSCLIVISLLLLVLAGGVYRFVFQGSVSGNVDGRSVIRLAPEERNLVLAEMRAFLISVQQITQGIAEKDMQRVADAARNVGLAAQGQVPGSLVGKLPLEFKRLGLDTHRKFDQLALDAGDLGEGDYALSQLAVLMQNCTACHAAYRIESSAE